MNRFVKSTVGLLSAVMVAGLAGCGGDTSWTFKSANAEITSGMYIGLSIDALQTAYSQEGIDTQKSVFKQQIEGFDGLTWVVNKTEELAKKYLAIEEKFTELGLAFTEGEQANIDSYVAAYWNYASSLYEEQGCGKESFSKLVMNTEKQQKLFDAVYGEGGEKAVSDADLRTYYNKDYVKANYISVPLIDDSRNALEGEELEARKDEANELLEKLKKNEDIEKVKAEYNAEDGEEAPAGDADTSEYIYKEGGYPEKLTTALFSAKDDAVGLTEDTNYIYVWKKLPLDDAGFEQNRSSILSRLKGDEFTESLTQWGNELEITKNESGIKKHSPKNLE